MAAISSAAFDAFGVFNLGDRHEPLVGVPIYSSKSTRTRRPVDFCDPALFPAGDNAGGTAARASAAELIYGAMTPCAPISRAV